MTEPEQWAVELWNRAADAADGCATQSFGDDAKAAALTIQRAFEERERGLREALRPFARIADQENRTPSGSSVLVNIDRCRDARAALGEK